MVIFAEYIDISAKDDKINLGDINARNQKAY